MALIYFPSFLSFKMAFLPKITLWSSYRFIISKTKCSLYRQSPTPKPRVDIYFQNDLLFNQQFNRTHLDNKKHRSVTCYNTFAHLKSGWSIQAEIQICHLIYNFWPQTQLSSVYELTLCSNTFGGDCISIWLSLLLTVQYVKYSYKPASGQLQLIIYSIRTMKLAPSTISVQKKSHIALSHNSHHMGL